MALTQVQPGMLASDSQYTGFKNRLINSAMVIDQRNAGASVTPANNNYTLDRWRSGLSQSSKYTVQQNAGSVTPPVGFTNYLGVTSSSAYTVGTSEYFFQMQRIEGYNIADLGWGTANAKTVTLSFWVRSSLTGTFGGALQNDNADRSYPFSYTISAANTWEQKSVTIAGETTGTWLTTNGSGIQLTMGLGVGATYSGTAGAWASSNLFSATGATSVVGTNGATFYITGVQLEKGSTATSFDYRPYGTELSLCQRYYYLLSAASNLNTFFHNLAASSTTGALGVITFPQVMRTSPTLTTSGTASNYRLYTGGAFTTCNAVPAIDQSCPFSSNVTYAVASGLTTGQGGSAAANGSTAAILGFGAEL